MPFYLGVRTCSQRCWACKAVAVGLWACGLIIAGVVLAAIVVMGMEGWR